MRAFCEKVITPTDASWRYHKYLMPYLPFSWHYHPEYEICLTLNSKGMRHIGDHIEEYGELDLVFVGPNLPHTWQSEATKMALSKSCM
ncbi:AraC family ligand binding domain-containing protein [Pseudoalteromonas spongiae]|uniref:AraC family ligand binding domain-containing protein n=1 Tax=Pseudoalteromonas spongiae TaxID=298657 RepID=UPI0039FD2AD3